MELQNGGCVHQFQRREDLFVARAGVEETWSPELPLEVLPNDAGPPRALPGT